MGEQNDKNSDSEELGNMQQIVHLGEPTSINCYASGCSKEAEETLCGNTLPEGRGPKTKDL